MSNIIDVKLDGLTSEVTTRPFLLVQMNFETIVRFSSRETINWSGEIWLSTDLKVTSLNTKTPTVTIFNELFALGNAVLTEGVVGKSIKIWKVYGETLNFSTPVLEFSGEMGQTKVGEYVIIKCKKRAPKKTPRHFAIPPITNHAPKAGTRIETAKSIFILEDN